MLAGGQRRAPGFQDPLEVSGMNGNGPVPALDTFQGETHILQPGLIEIVDVAVGSSGVNVCGR